MQELIEKAKEHKACKKTIRTIEKLTPEQLIAHEQAPFWFCWYCRIVVKGRWLEAEEVIRRDGYQSYIYARDVIKGAWPEAEEAIREDKNCAWLYAHNALRLNLEESMRWAER